MAWWPRPPSPGCAICKITPAGSCSATGSCARGGGISLRVATRRAVRRTLSSHKSSSISLTLDVEVRGDQSRPLIAVKTTRSRASRSLMQRETTEGVPMPKATQPAAQDASARSRAAARVATAPPMLWPQKTSLQPLLGSSSARSSSPASSRSCWVAWTKPSCAWPSRNDTLWAAMSVRMSFMDRVPRMATTIHFMAWSRATT
mmetsp:Transcript_100450/g.292788  ORF Transcript_100450/g.292788 Transcript_100450/m.292788 type:complete len:203 (+) Transcript_100450:277-885(+)